MQQGVAEIRGDLVQGAEHEVPLRDAGVGDGQLGRVYDESVPALPVCANPEKKMHIAM